MQRPGRNVVANFVGIGLASGAPLVFNVGYYRILGSEAYGLVGLFVTAQMLAVALDFGLSRTTTREVARHSARPEEASSVRSVILTLLSLNLVLFASVAASVAALAGWIAHSWLEPGRIDTDTAHLALVLIGVTIAVHQPRAIFLAALNGLQRQVVSNALLGTTAVLRGVVTVTVLSTSPTLAAFFWTQATMAAIETLAIALVTWRALPGSDRPSRPDPSLVRSFGRFALSDGLNVAIGTAMLNADKLILSGVLSLEAFGTYGMLSLLAQSLARLPTPFTIAYFPSMVALSERGDAPRLAAAYDQASRALSVLLIPAAVVAIAFAAPLVTVLLQDAGGVSRPGSVLAVLSVAFAAHALMHLPYTLQLACGWTRLSLATNAVVLALYVPLLAGLAPEHGIAVAPWLFLAATLLPLPIFVHLTHRRLLAGERPRWWLHIVAVPAAISCAIVVPARLATGALGAWPSAIVGGLAGLAALGVIARLQGPAGRGPRAQAS